MRKLKIYFDFIKIEHTLFALPFAYAGALLAKDLDLRTAILILTAFTGLRTAAMTFNRIIDREIDAKNPRTANRHIPRGIISLKEAYTIAAISLAIYFASAYLINKTAFILSPIPAFFAYIYPYLKRYTCLCHYVLGLNLAFAPMGGWIAVKDSFDILDQELLPLIFSISVIFWVAGFDMIYALQDVEFDRKEGLHSVAAHYGVLFAKKLARVNHLIFFLIILAFFIYIGSTAAFFLPIIAILLFAEHYIIRKDYDEPRIQISFFYLNAAVSVSLLFVVFLNYLKEVGWA